MPLGKKSKDALFLRTILKKTSLVLINHLSMSDIAYTEISDSSFHVILYFFLIYELLCNCHGVVTYIY
jgi:hypothetical protein